MLKPTCRAIPGQEDLNEVADDRPLPGELHAWLRIAENLNAEFSDENERVNDNNINNLNNSEQVGDGLSSQALVGAAVEILHGETREEVHGDGRQERTQAKAEPHVEESRVAVNATEHVQTDFSDDV